MVLFGLLCDDAIFYYNILGIARRRKKKQPTQQCLVVKFLHGEYFKIKIVKHKRSKLGRHGYDEQCHSTECEYAFCAAIFYTLSRWTQFLNRTNFIVKISLFQLFASILSWLQHDSQFNCNLSCIFCLFFLFVCFPILWKLENCFRIRYRLYTSWIYTNSQNFEFSFWMGKVFKAKSILNEWTNEKGNRLTLHKKLLLEFSRMQWDTMDYWQRKKLQWKLNCSGKNVLEFDFSNTTLYAKIVTNFKSHAVTQKILRDLYASSRRKYITCMNVQSSVKSLFFT